MKRSHSLEPEKSSLSRMEVIFCKELQEMKSCAMGILLQEPGYRELYIKHCTEEMGLALLEPQPIRLMQRNSWLQTRQALARKMEKMWALEILNVMYTYLPIGKRTRLIDLWYPQAKAIAMGVIWQCKILIPDSITVLSDKNEDVLEEAVDYIIDQKKNLDSNSHPCPHHRLRIRNRLRIKTK